MNNSLKLIIVILAVALSACKTKETYKPEQCFSKDDQATIIRQSVYYSTKLPPDATHQTKFDTTFNWYYNKAAEEFDMRACAPNGNDSSYYFLMTRKARSIWPAREAIGGKLKFVNNKLTDYEEIFRTWKMTEDTLNVRAFELFDLMVKGKDLEPFKSKYKGDRYIEFPDDRFYFNKEKKKWSDRDLDTVRFKN